MRAAILALLFVLVSSVAARADETRAAPDTHFVAIAFHDVVDSAKDLDSDALTTDAWVGFLEWIVAMGVHPVTLDDVRAAGRGERALPERPVLLMFDDGYRSLYTRVFPLLLAYRVPAVAALTGEWMDAPMDGTVRYGDADVPRRRFISWDEAREMAASGLVEFASHSYTLHRNVRADPHGTQRPAAVARMHDATSGYETPAHYRERLSADLARARESMRARLGKAPRALVWPYGRDRADSLAMARAAGFEFAFTLDSGLADAATPMRLARYLPRGNPSLGTLVGALRSTAAPPRAPSMVCVDPATLTGGDFEARLGRAIERLRELGATAVAIDPFARDADGAAVAAWFPTTLLPVRADVLSRIAWQMHTRAGVEMYVRMSRWPQALLDDASLATIVSDIADAAQVDGVLAGGDSASRLFHAVAQEYPAARLVLDAGAPRGASRGERCGP